jgi:hypothetical protein
LRHEILLAFATGGKRAGWGTIQSAFSGATARKISRFLEKILIFQVVGHYYDK